MNFSHRSSDEKNLQPHVFETRVRHLDQSQPRVIISGLAYQKMCLYIELAGKEVGWMGSVSRTTAGDFLIEDTFLLDQQVHETETELSADAIGKLTMSLIEGGQSGLDKANRLRFWGHSHVRMGTSPSGTDERTMSRFGREQMPWYVRGIFNKYGRAEFTLFLFDQGKRIDDAAWSVDLSHSELSIDSSLRVQVQAEFAEKVHERSFLFSAFYALRSKFQPSTNKP